jgi:cell division protein FtsB
MRSTNESVTQVAWRAFTAIVSIVVLVACKEDDKIISKMHQAQAEEAGYHEEFLKLEAEYTALRRELNDLQTTMRKPDYAKIPTDKVEVESRMALTRIEKAKAAADEVNTRLAAYSDKYLKH